MDLFEYAVVRVVPRVEREEFLNVGVVLCCPAQQFLQTRFEFSQERLRAFAGIDLDVWDLMARLGAFECICRGRPDGGPIGRLPLASRFRWLTATRSTIVQTSFVHPGLCHNAAQTLERLHTQLVG